MIGLSHFREGFFYLNYNSAHLRETIVSIYPKTWCAQAVDTDFQGTNLLLLLSYTSCKENQMLNCAPNCC